MTDIHNQIPTYNLHNSHNLYQELAIIQININSQFSHNYYTFINTKSLQFAKNCRNFAMQTKRDNNTMKKTSRKAAALEIAAQYNAYELRPVSVKTIYNRIRWTGCGWILNAKAYDYVTK